MKRKKKVSNWNKTATSSKETLTRHWSGAKDHCYARFSCFILQIQTFQKAISNGRGKWRHKACFCTNIAPKLFCYSYQDLIKDKADIIIDTGANPKWSTQAMGIENTRFADQYWQRTASCRCRDRSSQLFITDFVISADGRHAANRRSHRPSYQRKRSWLNLPSVGHREKKQWIILIRFFRNIERRET